MKYSHLIWDWNGTLLNDVWLCVQSMNTLLVKYNKKTVNETFYREVFDFPVKDYYEKLGFDFSIFDFNTIGHEFIHEYNKQINNLQLFDNAKDFISLSHQKFHLSILSAREHNQLLNELEYFGLKHYFSEIQGLHHNLADSKLNNGHKLIKNLNVPKEKIVLIGDTSHDFEVAQSLGINCILVAHGHHSRKRLELLNVEIVDNIQELKKKFDFFS